MANLKHVADNSKHGKMSAEITAEAQPAEVPFVQHRDGGPVPCSVPSFAAASELLSAPYSCLVMNTHRRHIALPPVYLNKKRTGIKEELETEMLKFSQSLKGVPMAYDDIRIVGQHGNIYDDSGYIHMEIEANFIVFQPQKGQKLLGKVNKLGMSHVGCLVHGCFNASIPKPNLVSMETWRDAGPRIDTDLEFEVTALDADMFGVLLIRGRLNRTRVQELLALNESSESNVTTDQPEPAQSDLRPEPAESDLRLEPAEESPAETPKKKKKKKRVKEEAMEVEITGLPTMLESNTTEELSRTTSEANGNEAGEKKKKKKKKEQHIKEEEEEIALSHTELQGGSDSSGYQSDKPSKKRKHEAMTDVTSSLSENTEAVKPKKKRKSDIKQFA
ncbi:DNA-directed RNA polymerase I subunit RPA43 [Cheilinus undulatus]|uniref:DNA-directed RNA polymerase I subunit RPA43 n=1 Tax=Cheilinus undulatus TaxID=241271 RepID=UPI001BD47D90|nr:DNA-directed RNA polymerase I subunit RPA43 [Cheilinus undulatus]